MTDYDALRQYVRACEYYGSLMERGPSWVPVHEPPTKKDREVLEHVRRHWQKEVDFCLRIMDQAEHAVKILPDADWRNIMTAVYLNGEEVMDASMNNYVSVRTAERYIHDSLVFLEKREKAMKGSEVNNQA